MKLTFLGATETVTGSKYLLEHDNNKILIDCGLFQGYKELRLRNWQKLPVDPATIDTVILTHAHIDHSGYIPLLVKQGFTGNILCSEATFDLCKILLPDSGYLHEGDAYRANRYGYTKHEPAVPLYTEKEARFSLQYFKPVAYGQKHALGESLHFTLNHSGHILGSAFVSITDGYKNIVFSGDLGRPHDAVMRTPAELQQADYLVIESTYGDRLHASTDPVEEIGKIINETVAKGGSVIIPAFAVGRAQSVLYYLWKLKSAGAIPDLPVYLDSPMAISATQLLSKHQSEHRLSEETCKAVCHVARYTKTVEESKAIADLHMPAIIISASGMVTGGRILHHLKYALEDYRNTVLFTGFQAGGTRGDRLVKGEKEIRIHGAMRSVKARIECLSNTSAHADYQEILDWLGHFENKPAKVFITHGELESAQSLQQKITERFGWNSVIPQYLYSEEL